MTTGSLLNADYSDKEPEAAHQAAKRNLIITSESVETKKYARLENEIYSCNIRVLFCLIIARYPVT